MKKNIFIYILMILIIGCGKKESQNEKKDKVKPMLVKTIHQSHNKNIDKIPLLSKNQTPQMSPEKPIVASNKVVNKKIKEFTKDVHHCTTEEKINMVLQKLNLRKLSKEKITTPGIHTMDDVVNKIFDLSRPVTSNDVSDLSNLNPRQLVDLADELLDYYLMSERLAILYEVCLRECNSPYVRAESANQLAYIDLFDENASDFDSTKLLKLAIKLGRENESNPELSNVESESLAQLNANYWNNGDYKNCLNIAKQRFEYALRNPNENSGSLIGYSIKIQIDCLNLLGKNKDSLELLEKAKEMKNISKQYQKIFNSDKYNK